MESKNMSEKNSNGTASSNSSSRRDFIKTGTVASAAAAVGLGTPSLSLARSAHVVGRETIKIGLIGCGGRGTAATVQAMNTQSGNNVELHAMADVFESQGQNSLNGISAQKGDRVKVGDKLFIGLDGYKESSIPMSTK